METGVEREGRISMVGEGGIRMSRGGWRRRGGEVSPTNEVMGGRKNPHTVEENTNLLKLRCCGSGKD